MIREGFMRFCLLLFIILFCVSSCTYDDPYGFCTDYSNSYCDGVYLCSDHSGADYVKVGSERYRCVESWLFEGTYDCSEGFAFARGYCEESYETEEHYDENTFTYEQEPVEVEDPTTPVAMCHTNNTENPLCYSLMPRSKCEECELVYSEINDDECSSDLLFKICPPSFKK